MGSRAGVASGGGGGGAGPSSSAIDVAAGCPSNPASPTDPNSKVWHFDFGAGHSQSYYASNPVPAGHYAGDASFPYDNPNAITALITGWTKPLEALAVWNHSGSTHSDYSAIGTVTVTVNEPATIGFGAVVVDGAGRKFILASHTFTGAGTTNLAIVAQATGAASNDPVGTVFTGHSGIQAQLTAASSGTNTITFTSALPSWVAAGEWVTDTTTAGVTSNNLITSVNFGTKTITLTSNLTGGGVVASDLINFNGPGVTPDSITLTADMAGGADFRVLDTNHDRLWPGDVVELDGPTQFPSISYGGTANLTVANTDASGNPDYVWFEGDGTNPPHVSGMSIGQTTGVIVKGVYVDHTNPLSQWNSSSILGEDVTFARGAIDGDTFTVNNEVWTYTTGTPGFHQIGVPSGGTAAQTASATYTMLTTTGDAATLGWTSYHLNGANLSFSNTGFNPAGPIPSFGTSIIQTATEAPVGIGNVGGSSQTAAVKVSGGFDGEATDIYLTGLYIDASQASASTPFQMDDYPETGSLGISEVTGLQDPAKVGGPWNAVDWIFQTRAGFSTVGSTQSNPLINPADPIGGVQCVTLAHSFIKYGTVGLSVGSSKHVLIEDVTTDYAGSDAMVNGNSNYTDWEFIKNRNVVDNGSGAHPDGWQGQSTITFTGTDGWHDITINGYSIYPASDTTLSALSYHDFNNVSRPMAGEPTGIQTTITTYYNMTVTNSAIFSHNCPNLSINQGYNLTIANNTVLWDGADPTNPNLFACTTKNGQITVNASDASHGIPMPFNIVLTNNVANVFNRGPVGETCADGVFFHNDRAVLSYYEGSDQDISNQGVCPSSTSGTIAFQSLMTGTTWESGNLISLPTTPLSSIFTSYAPSGFPANLATQFDVTPITGSPLIGAGTASFGAPTKDLNGVARPNPPSIGALEP